MKKRLLSAFLALSMIFSIMPTTIPIVSATSSDHYFDVTDVTFNAEGVPTSISLTANIDAGHTALFKDDSQNVTILIVGSNKLYQYNSGTPIAEGSTGDVTSSDCEQYTLESDLATAVANGQDASAFGLDGTTYYNFNAPVAQITLTLNEVTNGANYNNITLDSSNMSMGTYGGNFTFKSWIDDCIDGGELKQDYDASDGYYQCALYEDGSIIDLDNPVYPTGEMSYNIYIATGVYGADQVQVVASSDIGGGSTPAPTSEPTATPTAAPTITYVDDVTISGITAPQPGAAPITAAPSISSDDASNITAGTITWGGTLSGGNFTTNQAYTADFDITINDTNTEFTDGAITKAITDSVISAAYKNNVQITVTKDGTDANKAHVKVTYPAIKVTAVSATATNNPNQTLSPGGTYTIPSDLSATITYSNGGSASSAYSSWTSDYSIVSSSDSLTTIDKTGITPATTFALGDDAALYVKYDGSDTETGNPLYDRFGSVAVSRTPLTTASITYAAPVAGANTSASSVTSDDTSKYTVDSDTWTTGGSAATKFEYGKTYQLETILKSVDTDGYYFNEDPNAVTVTLNDGSATAPTETVTADSSTQVTVTHTYTIPALTTSGTKAYDYYDEIVLGSATDATYTIGNVDSSDNVTKVMWGSTDITSYCSWDGTNTLTISAANLKTIAEAASVSSTADQRNLVVTFGGGDATITNGLSVVDTTPYYVVSSSYSHTNVSGVAITGNSPTTNPAAIASGSYNAGKYPLTKNGNYTLTATPSDSHVTSYTWNVTNGSASSTAATYSLSSVAASTTYTLTQADGTLAGSHELEITFTDSNNASNAHGATVVSVTGSVNGPVTANANGKYTIYDNDTYAIVLNAPTDTHWTRFSSSGAATDFSNATSPQTVTIANPNGNKTLAITVTEDANHTLMLTKAGSGTLTGAPVVTGTKASAANDVPTPSTSGNTYTYKLYDDYTYAIVATPDSYSKITATTNWATSVSGAVSTGTNTNDTYTFSAPQTGDSAVTLTVDAKTAATVSPSSVTVHTSDATETATYTFTAGDYPLSAVKIGSTTLTVNTDYTYNSTTGAVVISHAAAVAQSSGSKNVTFECGMATEPTATLKVTGAPTITVTAPTTTFTHGDAFNSTGFVITITDDGNTYIFSNGSWNTTPPNTVQVKWSHEADSAYTTPAAFDGQTTTMRHDTHDGKQVIVSYGGTTASSSAITVNQKPIIITIAGSFEKVYDGTSTVLQQPTNIGITAGDLVGSDSVTVTDLTFTNGKYYTSTTGTETIHAGAATAVGFDAAAATTGSVADNYTYTVTKLDTAGGATIGIAARKIKLISLMVLSVRLQRSA